VAVQVLLDSPAVLEQRRRPTGVRFWAREPNFLVVVLS